MIEEKEDTKASQSKSMQGFVELSPMQKEVLPSHKLQDHAYQY